MTSISRLLALLAIAGGLSSLSQAQSSSNFRTWTSQDGRALQAEMIGIQDGNVSLRLENGTVAIVPLARLSAADQSFARTATPAAGTATTTPASVPASPLVWPEIITVSPKDLEIRAVEENAKDRRFVYQSGSFRFIADAPLTTTVMREIAGDFELTRNLFVQLPWGWQPMPLNGNPHFEARLFEFEKDYVAAGGQAGTSAGSNNDFIFTKFSSLGLKKVGERYAFDTKSGREGNLTSMISRFIIGDMRNFLFAWSNYGLQEFVRRGGYRNNSYALARPHNTVKTHLDKQRSFGDTTDLTRMLTFLRSPNNEPRAHKKNSEMYLDGMLLVFFFGYLDDDTKGTKLHQYYRTAAQDALAYRAYEVSGRTTTLPFKNGRTARVTELMNSLIRDRTDDQLRTEMREKFASIGIKL